MGHKRQTFGAACMKSNIRFFRFGPFSLDAQERVLRRDGTRVNLQGQPYQILEVLLTRAGKLVTRDELRETLWPGDTYVDFEHGLNTSVKKLRLVLGDSAEKPSYIETVRGFGYRFVVSVEVDIVETSAPEPTAPVPRAGFAGRGASEPQSERKGQAKFDYGIDLRDCRANRGRSVLSFPCASEGQAADGE